MLDNLKVLEKENIEDEADLLKYHGYRFAAMTCDSEGDDFELTYHFDKDYALAHLRIVVKPFDKIKSISKIYPSAFLIENEYQDLYGFEFENLIVDYKGNLYLTKSAEKAPWVDKKGE